MLIDNIKIGDRIEINLLRDNRLGKVYISQVEEILSENEVLIHVPISYGQLVKLSLREKYSMLFFTEKGMVRFDSEIISYTKENEFNFMQVRLISEGERIQRREFFRFSCLLPMKFAKIDGEIDENIITNKPIVDGIIKDLGGGGIRFVSNESIEEGKKIKSIIMLGDECLVVLGKVLHKQFFPKSNFKYQYRIEFFGMQEAEQEKVIQYIFNEQRKTMRKIELKGMTT